MALITRLLFSHDILFKIFLQTRTFLLAIFLSVQEGRGADPYTGSSLGFCKFKNSKIC